MGEDKLTADQRLRLESFAQALSSGMTVRIEPLALPVGVAHLRPEDYRPPTMADVFKRAEEIETWLKKAGT